MKKRIKIGIAIVATLFGLIIVWGFIEPYLIDVQEEEAVITNLPSELEGKKIVVIGDFQVGLWMDNLSTTERIVEDVIEMEPSAILITGDYLYHVESMDDQVIDEIMNAMSPLVESGIPVYSVLGNHDYTMASQEVEPNIELAEGLSDALSSLGIRMLDNENDVLVEGENPSENFYIVGIGSHWAENDLPEEAFEGVTEEAPRLVLMHNPDSFRNLEANSAPLAVAGHTHGGQIRTPFSSNWSYLSLAQGGEVTADGWIEDYGSEENNLYVNRGIGMSIVPMRINAVPEITVFTLTSND
ncbi:MAG: metallophosphoesterase [Alkalibacterium sp.]|uniref:metallophosphoesterase n=1 Tax=Alkalibacterium sp. TaxID=1872447 RepID=UPI003970664B